MNYPINNKNIIGWLNLILDVYQLDDITKDKLIKYLKRNDISKRQKEIDDMFGGEEW
jgi:hypothetical protein